MNNSYDDTENKILGNLLRIPLNSKSLNQLSKDVSLSYVTVFKVVPELEKKKLVVIEKKGKSNLVSIDFVNASLQKLSSSIIFEQIKLYKKQSILKLISNEIEEHLSSNFYALLLFGSYAKGTARKDSDIDLLLIVPAISEDYSEKLSNVFRLYPKINCKIIKAKDFSEMLNQRNSVGRAAFENGIVLFGAEQYYLMVKSYVRQKGY